MTPPGPNITPINLKSQVYIHQGYTFSKHFSKLGSPDQKRAKNSDFLAKINHTSLFSREAVSEKRMLRVKKLKIELRCSRMP